MNILKNIAHKNLQLNKKRNIVTIIGIILSVALITALSSLVVSFKESIINLEKHINGDFHYSFDGVQSNDLSIFENNRSIEKFYKVGTLGYAKINTENEYKPYAYVITMDKNDFNSVGINLTDGELPKNNNEIIIPRHLRNNGKVDLKVGDTITLEVGSRMSEGYALGQNNPYEETNNETIENTVSVTYKVVGIFERPSTALEPFSSPGYTFITTNASGVKNYKVFARYTKDGLKNQYKVTAGILGMDAKLLEKDITLDSNYIEISEKELAKSKYTFDVNRYLIMLETNAYGDSSMKALLVLSAIVTVIIIVTSVCCIKNSFNISITEKTKEYGILKSVGATTSQIKKSVYYEAFLLGSVGIPIGVISGILASFILIHVVNFFIKNMFVGNEYLIFKISYLSIVISIILSIVTIFMSSKKGAKIASKTSPMVLIRGNNDILVNSKKLKTPKFINKLFGIGGVVSYKNIKRNKKKYRTTIVSIVLSVSVYIALSYFVNTAFDVVKMAKGDYTYNLVYTSYTKDYNLNYNNVLNFSKHDTVKKYSVVRTSTVTGNFKASKDFKKYNAYMSFSVEKGEFVSIVGASGSGKSTLLHLLGGVDRPTSGKVFINDTDIFKMNDDELAIFRRRQVGLIYQFYNLIPILNVRENITLPLELDNKRVSDEEVDNLIKMLGLDKRSKHLPNELSGGEQQRTSIGRALISRPAIVLADEPTGNLDTKASEEIVSLLKKSNKEMKQTIIMITHNLELAKVADKIIEIADGRIVGEEK